MTEDETGTLARVTSLSSARLRAFVRKHTRLQPVPDVPGLRLHMGSDVMALCALAGAELGMADPDLPYWAFPWAGGLAVARHLIERPAEVAGLRVLDLAAGSGLCGFVAAREGALRVVANDIDPLAGAAVWLNARENRHDVGFVGRDMSGDGPPDVDVILAGDVCYQPGMAARLLPWLAAAAASGTRVLMGDPGRAYLPVGLERVATYSVTTSRELESAASRETGVYTFARPLARTASVVGDQADLGPGVGGRGGSTA